MTTMLRVMLRGIFPSKPSRRLHIDVKEDSSLRGVLPSFSSFGGGDTLAIVL